MKQLREYTKLLNFLYGNEMLFVEEIAVIENMCRYPDIKVYVDRTDNIGAFMLTQYNEDMTWSVFLHSPSDESFLNNAVKILPKVNKLHIQTGVKEKSIISGRLFFKHTYDYSMMSLLMEDFNDNFTDKYENADAQIVRLTPDSGFEEMEEWFGYGVYRLREEIRNGVYFAIKEGGQWAAIAGTQIKSCNCSYIFVSTEAPYRGRGYAKALVSAVCNELFIQGRTPVYALDSSNIPSVRLAKSLGFKEYARRECLFAGPWELFRPFDDNPGLPDSNYFE